MSEPGVTAPKNTLNCAKQRSAVVMSNNKPGGAPNLPRSDGEREDLHDAVLVAWFFVCLSTVAASWVQLLGSPGRAAW